MEATRHPETQRDGVCRQDQRREAVLPHPRPERRSPRPGEHRPGRGLNNNAAPHPAATETAANQTSITKRRKRRTWSRQQKHNPKTPLVTSVRATRTSGTTETNSYGRVPRCLCGWIGSVHLCTRKSGARPDHNASDIAERSAHDQWKQHEHDSRRTRLTPCRRKRTIEGPATPRITVSLKEF